MSRTVVIIAASSDIGNFLVRQYLQTGANVIATYRNKDHFNFDGLGKYVNDKKLVMFPLRIGNVFQATGLEEYIEKTKTKLDTIIFLNASMEPIGKFMDINYYQWESAIMQNTLLPLHLMQKLIKKQNDHMINVVFMSGGGINGTQDYTSAYTISKIIFHKFAELINSEEKNIKPIVIGPSYVKTKIHDQTLSKEETKKRTQEYLNSGDGTPMKDIFDLIESCCKMKKSAVGGRNFSVKHDKWKDKGFEKQLINNPKWGKMRRYVGMS